MEIFYVLSVFYLLIMFLLYKKTDKKMCIISAIIYSLGLLFCYNTFVVFLFYMLGINGNVLLFSIINYFIGIVISAIMLLKGKKIQKYFFDKKKLVVFLCLGVIIFLIGYFRFQGFEAVNFESGDSAIHYRHALEFSKNLSILDRSNTNDEVFGSFVRVMPISYVNCGLLFNIFSNMKTHTVFFIYNVVCLILSAGIFLVTIMDVFKYKKKDYIYALVFTLFYILAFPFNSFIMGFCYLSLGIMVINLLYLTVFHFKSELDKKSLFKIIVLFLIAFGIFFSYYLFVPAVYLALGLYYIYLFKKGEISFKLMFIYGLVTLVIPFIIGFSYFLITLFIDAGIGSVAKLIDLWGYTYDNITPMYLFLLVTAYFVYDLALNGIKKFDYIKVSIYIVTVFIAIFLILYMIRVSDLYYFYKLFYLYWLLLLLFFQKKFLSYRKIFYIILGIFLVINMFVYFNPKNKLSLFLVETNVYTWNVSMFNGERAVFNKDELELTEHSIKYKDICLENGKFLILGNRLKNIWFYSITDSVPVLGNIGGDAHNIYINNVSNFGHWEYILDYDCLVYYYEGKHIAFNKDRYNILFENSAGAIIRKK